MVIIGNNGIVIIGNNDVIALLKQIKLFCFGRRTAI